MPPRPTHTARTSLPPPRPPERQKVQSGLDRLRNRREGSAATAIVMAVLLPFAIAWHAYLPAIGASLIGAMILALGCHVARERRLTVLVAFPEFAQLPDLAGKRKRLASARNRRALADGLRRAASPTQPPRRFDCCPVLGDRVAAVRPELLELAGALEQTHDPAPVCVALIHELLTNGCSPLYNLNAPAADVHLTLSRARDRLTAQPPA